MQRSQESGWPARKCACSLEISRYRTQDTITQRLALLNDDQKNSLRSSLPLIGPPSHDDIVWLPRVLSLGLHCETCMPLHCLAYILIWTAPRQLAPCGFFFPRHVLSAINTYKPVIPAALPTQGVSKMREVRIHTDQLVQAHNPALPSSLHIAVCFTYVFLDCCVLHLLTGNVSALFGHVLYTHM